MLFCSKRHYPRPAGGGGGCLSTPRGFSRIAKTRRREAPLFYTLSAINYAPFLKILSPGHLGSGHQVRSSDPTSWKKLWCYSSYSSWAINIKLSGYHKTINSYKTCSSDFLFQWSNVRSILWPPHYKAMGKNQITPLRIRSGNFIMEWVTLGYCSWSRSKFWSVAFIKVILVRMTSSEVTNRFLLIIDDWKELPTRAWSHCVHLAKTHRLICSMTYLGQHVTARDLDLKSNSDLTFQGQVLKLFCQKMLFWRSLTPAAKLLIAVIWLHASKRTAKELSNAFSLASYLK